jgi:hypothetical protein
MIGTEEATIGLGGRPEPSVIMSLRQSSAHSTVYESTRQEMIECPTFDAAH